ncbi:MAG: alpha/beta hydrolase [Acidimicrobiia bacterium]|jgi:hypothetical protein
MSRLDLGFEWEGIEFAGTLHLPSTPAPHPTVIMLQGSGPADRDADGYFNPIRRAFLEADVGVYSFDKPGCGESGGDWRDHDLQTRADQASAARAMLRARPEVVASLVGFWGQSQGGWLVQILAARHDLPFAISNSGPSIGVESQDLYACEQMMRADGFAEDDIARALVSLRSVHAAAARGAAYAEVSEEILAPASAHPWLQYLPTGNERDWGLMCRFVAEAYEPLEAVRRIEGPFLAIYGARDVLVPAWESARDVGRALEVAPTVDSAVVVFPHGDHRIRVANGDGFAAGYLELLRDWIGVRVLP